MNHAIGIAGLALLVQGCGLLLDLDPPDPRGGIDGGHAPGSREAGTRADGAVAMDGAADSASSTADAARIDGAAVDGGAPTDSRVSVDGAALDGSVEWLRCSVTFGGFAGDQARAVAADASGNAYITGYFAGTVDFGGELLSSSGPADGFVASFDPTCQLRWAIRFGGPGGLDRGEDIALAENGTVFVVGTVSGELGLELPLPVGTDAIVLRLDARGTLLGAGLFGGIGDDEGLAVATSPTGSLRVAGVFSGRLGLFGEEASSRGDRDVFVAGVSPPNLDSGWWTQIGGASVDRVSAIAVDPNGGTHVVGSFVDRIQINSELVADGAGQSAFHAVLSSTGNPLHLAGLSATGGIRAFDVAVDDDSMVWMAGEVTGRAAIGPFVLDTDPLQDGFLIAVDATGPRLALPIDATGPVQARVVLVDDGKVGVAGRFRGSSSWGPALESTDDSTDVFGIAVRADGTFRTALALGGGGDELVAGAAGIASGVWLTGHFVGDTAFGAGTASSEAEDAFLAWINEP